MTNGSHGCINLPPSVAKVIFENISQGTPVLCYHLDGSDNQKAAGSQKGNASQPTAAPVQPTAPVSSAPASETPAAPVRTESPEGSSAEIPPAEETSPSQSLPETSPTEQTSVPEVPVGPEGAMPETSPEESSPSPENPADGGAGTGETGNPLGGETQSSPPAGPHEAVFETTTEIGPGV